MSKFRFGLIAAFLAVFIGSLIGFSSVNNAEADGGPRKVSVKFDMPAQVYTGESFYATAKITNEGGITAGFNATILYGGPCWGNQPYFTDRTPGTDVYWHEDYADGQRVFWSGKVEPGQTAFYKQTTGSSAKAGVCKDFATATFIVTTPQGEVKATQRLTVVGKPAPKPVIFEVSPAQIFADAGGDWVTVNLHVNSQGGKVSQTWASIKFDPSIIEVVDMDPNTAGVQGSTNCGITGLVENELRYAQTSANAPVDCYATWRVKGKSPGTTPLLFVINLTGAMLKKQNLPVQVSGGQFTAKASPKVSWQVKLGPQGVWSKLSADPARAITLTRYISTNNGNTYPSTLEQIGAEGKIFDFTTEQPLPYGLALGPTGQIPFASAQWNSTGNGCMPGPDATFRWPQEEIVVTNRDLKKDLSLYVSIDTGTPVWSTIKAGETRTFPMSSMKQQGLIALGSRCGELFMTRLPQ